MITHMSKALTTNIDGTTLTASPSDSPSTDRPEYLVSWEGTEYAAVARVEQDRVEVSEFGDIDGMTADNPELHAACVAWLEGELLG